MLYSSTQNKNEVVSAAQAIAQGISKDGGLFVPQEFPKYDSETFKALLKEDYRGRAKKVFSDFLTDFTAEEIDDCVTKAYTAQKFDGENPAPLAFTSCGYASRYTLCTMKSGFWMRTSSALPSAVRV